MGVDKLCKNDKIRYITSDISGFHIQFYITENHHTLKPEEREALLNQFADQKRRTVGVNGTISEEVCLGNNREVVQDNLVNNDYTAICIVDNGEDKAIGALQYYDWCESGVPQLWINDVCRITTGEKSAESPVKILLSIFEVFAKSKGLVDIFLAVDDKEPERNVLPKIYERYGYRGLKEDEICVREELIVMKKDLLPVKMGGKTRKNRSTRWRKRART